MFFFLFFLFLFSLMNGLSTFWEWVMYIIEGKDQIWKYKDTYVVSEKDKFILIDLHVVREM